MHGVAAASPAATGVVTVRLSNMTLALIRQRPILLQCINTKLCAFADFTERAFGRELLAALEVAPPTALPVVGARGRVRRSRAHPVFANSRGEITAYDAHGKLQWQVC